MSRGFAVGGGGDGVFCLLPSINLKGWGEKKKEPWQ